MVADGFKPTVEAILEINRPELLCYLFAGWDAIDDTKVIPHFGMGNTPPSASNKTAWALYKEQHTIPSRFPVKIKVTNTHFKADNVVRSAVMQWNSCLQVLPIEDVALIEKAMRIGLSSIGAKYACGGCEESFMNCGLSNPLTVDIMKDARVLI